MFFTVAESATSATSGQHRFSKHQIKGSRHLERLLVARYDVDGHAVEIAERRHRADFAVGEEV